MLRSGTTVAADSTPRRPVQFLDSVEDAGVARGRHLVTPERRTRPGSGGSG